MSIRKRSSTPPPTGPSDPPPDLTFDGAQVVKRRCTLCDWDAQVIEKPGDDPLCPWCYAPTVRHTVVGVVVPEHLTPGVKNPYAASLGRLGGLKGGPARANKLSARRRREIAIKAAKARWGKGKR